MIDHPFDAVDEAALRLRRSAKWALYPPDVLPAWVAEMDYPIAAPIRRVLIEAIDRGDAGYASGAGLGEAFASWAAAHWQWEVDPAHVHLVADVVTGITELLRVATAPGDAVVIEPPVYPPFAGTVRALGRRVVEAPLLRSERGEPGWAPDLAAIERAYAGGAKVHLLCSPQNPTGIVYSRDLLVAVAALAERHGVLVLADEIHAPLVLPGATHVPFPSVSDAARRTSIVLTSASKAWNVAGLKAAAMIASGEGPRAVLARLPPETPYHAGHLGVLGGIAAFREGGAWLAQVEAILDRNRRLLGELLGAELPGVGYVMPQAGYLAWLDCNALGLGADPAAAFLARGRVALSSGPTFGAQGQGFVRLNLGTSRRLLEEAVTRMKRSLGHMP
ncbi:MAG TPA: aminotransferase class I/II-fold pyridoxal phosphate-dependent enzyme [Polyangiaceae bacterium]|jgi:cystathionine beta-lyase|nr:aminotransferase class I/II-fold pyridoxal phosphate-dependent enzyme [Polyangiaceae bacterium]